MYRLEAFIISELAATPVEQWAPAFPIDVAAWRYLDAAGNGLLGTVCAGNDGGRVWFSGERADWFCHRVLGDARYAAEANAVMEPLLADAESGPGLRRWVRIDQVPALDGRAVGRLQVLLDSILCSRQQGPN